jgi:hypothetical protein
LPSGRLVGDEVFLVHILRLCECVAAVTIKRGSFEALRVGPNAKDRTATYDCPFLGARQQGGSDSAAPVRDMYDNSTQLSERRQIQPPGDECVQPSNHLCTISSSDQHQVIRQLGKVFMVSSSFAERNWITELCREGGDCRSIFGE